MSGMLFYAMRNEVRRERRILKHEVTAHRLALAFQVS